MPDQVEVFESLIKAQEVVIDGQELQLDRITRERDDLRAVVEELKARAVKGQPTRYEVRRDALLIAATRLTNTATYNDVAMAARATDRLAKEFEKLLYPPTQMSVNELNRIFNACVPTDRSTSAPVDKMRHGSFPTREQEDQHGA